MPGFSFRVLALGRTSCCAVKRPSRLLREETGRGPQAAQSSAGRLASEWPVGRPWLATCLAFWLSPQAPWGSCVPSALPSVQVPTRRSRGRDQRRFTPLHSGTIRSEAQSLGSLAFSFTSSRCVVSLDVEMNEKHKKLVAFWIINLKNF